VAKYNIYQAQPLQLGGIETNLDIYYWFFLIKFIYKKRGWFLSLFLFIWFFMLVNIN
jgi:hypothetical protein